MVIIWRSRCALQITTVRKSNNCNTSIQLHYFNWTTGLWYYPWEEHLNNTAEQSTVIKTRLIFSEFGISSDPPLYCDGSSNNVWNIYYKLPFPLQTGNHCVCPVSSSVICFEYTKEDFVMTAEKNSLLGWRKRNNKSLKRTHQTVAIYD